MKRYAYILFQLIIIPLVFFSSVAQEPDAGDLVDITWINPNIILDIRYATENNFLNEKVYPEARCFVRYAVAIRLDSVQRELETIGLGLKIFDGFRPYDVQKKMWEVMPDNRYVANPYDGGSRHNRGAAVDVSLVDTCGNELPMPTGFDDFSEKAHQAFEKLPAEVRQNRWILRTIMEKYGFSPIKSEWWHYDLNEWKKYELLKIDFKALSDIKTVYRINSEK